MSQEPDPTADFPEVATEAATPDQQRRAVNQSLLGEEPESIPPIPGYTIRRLLGAGTFGQVWAGIQDRTGLEVAIKLFARDSGLDWLYFRHEVERLRRVSEHPYVVTLLDADLTHDPPYFVMVLLPDSLAHRVREHGSPDPATATRWIQQMAEALHFTHGKGLLHCDLKPNNIMVDQENRVRVADFGQSMSRGTSGEAMLGTLGTMAPEQATLGSEGLPDVSWDVYGLGATAYWMLTGQLPRINRDGLNALNAIKDPRERLQTYRTELAKLPLKPVRSLNPRVDQDLADIVEGCLQPDPLARTRTVADVLEDFRRRRLKLPLLCRQPWSVGYRAQRFLARHAVPVVLGAALMVGLGWSYANVVSSRNQAVEANGRSQVLLAELEFDQAVTLADAGQQQQAANWFARAAARKPGDPTYLLPLRNWPVRLIDYRDLGDAMNAVMDPTGSNHVVWRRMRDLSVLLDGSTPAGPAIPLACDAFPVLALSPDAAYLAVSVRGYGEPSHFALFDVKTGQAVQGPLTLPETFVTLEFSSDSRRLLEATRSSVELVQAHDGRSILRHRATGGATAINEDGTQIAFSDGPRVKLARAGRPDLELDLHDPVFLGYVAGGRLLLSLTPQGMAELWDTTTGQASPHTLECGHSVHHALMSPDRKLLLAMGPDSATLVNIADGSVVTTVPCGRHLTAAQDALGGCFSPDSSLMAISFVTPRLGGQSVDAVQLYRTGDGLPVGVPIAFLETIADVAFSRDNHRLFVSTNGGMQTYDLSHLLDNKPTAVLQGAVFTREFPLLLDPRIAVCQELGQVRVTEIATGKLLSEWSTDAVLEHCLVSPDGQTLLPRYADTNTLQPLALRTGQPVGKAATCSARIRDLAFTRDGRQFATCCQDGSVQVWALDGNPVGKPIQLSYAVTGLDFDPSGRFLYTLGENREVKVWDLTTRRDVVTAEGSLAVFGTHQGKTRVAVASNLMSRAGDHPTIKTFTVPDGRPVGPPIRMLALQTLLLFHPGDGYLLVPNMNGITRLWNPVTTQPVGRELPVDQMFWCAFDDRGEWLATTSLGTLAARLWDIRSGRPLTRQDQFQVGAGESLNYRVAAFGPGRDRLLIRSQPSRGPASLQVWDLSVDRDLPSEVLTLEAETWTGMRLEPQGGLVALSEPEWRQSRERLSTLLEQHRAVCKFPQASEHDVLGK